MKQPVDSTGASTPLPRYRCHKEVWALKIKSILPLRPRPLLTAPCAHRAGSAECGYGPNGCMHTGSDSDVIPPEGRHAYTPGPTDAAMITPEESGYAPFLVDKAYLRRHQPKVGGYYVVYKDGYESFSPAEAFEEGYSRA